MAIRKEPFHEYMAFKQHLTSTKLRKYIQDPLIYKWNQDNNWPHTDSPSMLFGRALHTMLLEGDNCYGEAWHVEDCINPRTGKPYGKETKAYTEWREAISNRFPNKEVIDLATHNRVYELAQIVRKNPFFKAFCTGGVAERVIRGKLHGRDCQCRIDYLKIEGNDIPATWSPEGGSDAPALITDLKTTDNLDRFNYAIRDYGYLYQLAFYAEMFEHFTEQEAETHILAVETKPPYRVGLWEAPVPVMLDYRKKVQNYIEDLVDSEKHNTWFSRYDEIQEIVG